MERQQAELEALMERRQMQAEVQRQERMEAAQAASIYAPHVAKIQQRLGDNRSQMLEGDTRKGGFFGIGGQSREELEAELQREMLKIRGLQLQELVARGVMDEAEAEEEAVRLRRIYGGGGQ